jgi:hypothetical protein
VPRTSTDLDPLAAARALPAAPDRGGDLPHRQAPARHPADRSPARRDHPRHVFARFLALVLRAELEQRIAALGRTASWTETLADLDSLTETGIAHDGKRFLVRAAPRPAARLALRAAGDALPPTVRPLSDD